jgi:5,10-methylenetetrahydromethanopterin reductase
MRIGVMVGAGDGANLDQLIQGAQRAEAAGFASLWMANIFAYDAITALAVIGRATQRIELGTAVVPSYPRHPLAIAQQALTTNAASGGRFTLGIGLSHKIVIEGMFGLSYAHPARHMAEYLAVLTPLLRGAPVDFKGEEYKTRAALQVPGGPPVRLLVAALGPVMLRLTGRLADGTITWMTGTKTLASHIAPTLRSAAKEAGRPEPRIVCGLPIGLVRDPAKARETASKQFSIYGQLPSYRAMLDREGAAQPGDVAIVGDEKALRAGIAQLRDAGVTDFCAATAPLEPGCAERTLEFLAAER